MTRSFRYFLLQFIIFLSSSHSAFTQGTWTALNNLPPDNTAGVMLLLTDGSVMVKTADGIDNDGTVWNKLTPDAYGSYINGTWSVIAPMNDSRYYFSSQVLQNGKVYVAGGEYGTGGNTAELYDPVADSWSYIPGIDLTDTLADANSQMLADGRILQNVVLSDSAGYGVKNIIYDPVANTFALGPQCRGNADESSWLLLPDKSILFVDVHSLLTERYIPATNKWIRDTPAPVLLYDTYIYEDGPSIMLPNGKAFFIGGNSNTAIYTPSGDTMPGSWVRGPQIPDNNAIPDGVAAMMPNGVILCAVSPASNSYNTDSLFHSPTYFYEYNYLTNSFALVSAPTGSPQIASPNGEPYITVAAYTNNMLNLPDGTVLFSTAYDNQFYVYAPGSAPIAAGKPTVRNVSRHNCEFMITGTLFNGISQGAAYGDDWQMATNYPIVQLTANNGEVYYARTHNWNSTGIQTGNLADTAYFSIPDAVANGDYSLFVSANGISSDAFNFNYTSCTTGVEGVSAPLVLRAFPNPAHDKATILFSTNKAAAYSVTVADVCGRIISVTPAQAINGANSYSLDLKGMAAGVYLVSVAINQQMQIARIVVE